MHKAKYDKNMILSYYGDEYRILASHWCGLGNKIVYFVERVAGKYVTIFNETDLQIISFKFGDEIEVLSHGTWSKALYVGNDESDYCPHNVWLIEESTPGCCDDNSIRRV